MLGGSVDELEGNELEATLLETANDVANESTLDAVGLVTRGEQDGQDSEGDASIP